MKKDNLFVSKESLNAFMKSWMDPFQPSVLGGRPSNSQSEQTHVLQVPLTSPMFCNREAIPSEITEESAKARPFTVTFETEVRVSETSLRFKLRHLFVAKPHDDLCVKLELKYVNAEPLFAIMSGSPEDVYMCIPEAQFRCQ